MLTPARTIGVLFLVGALAFGGVAVLGLAAGFVSPVLVMICCWLAATGVYQIATNVTSTTPEIPAWWTPGLAALTVGSLVVGALLARFVF